MKDQQTDSKLCMVVWALVYLLGLFNFCTSSGWPNAILCILVMVYSASAIMFHSERTPTPKPLAPKSACLLCGNEVWGGKEHYQYEVCAGCSDEINKIKHVCKGVDKT